MVILSVPYCQQETVDTCAPACLRMALKFRFPKDSISEAKLAKRCRCLKGLGSLVDDVYRAARRFKLTGNWLNSSSIEAEVESALKGGCPVLANVQPRVLPYIPSSKPPRAWHSVLIFGIDDRYVYVHDPDPTWGGSEKTIERGIFFSGWGNHPYSAYSL